MQIAHVAELVDAHGSGPCAARCGGSNPSVGTITAKDKTESLENIIFQGFFVVQKQNSSIQCPNARLEEQKLSSVISALKSIPECSLASS